MNNIYKLVRLPKSNKPFVHITYMHHLATYIFVCTFSHYSLFLDTNSCLWGCVKKRFTFQSFYYIHSTSYNTYFCSVTLLRSVVLYTTRQIRPPTLQTPPPSDPKCVRSNGSSCSEEDVYIYCSININTHIRYMLVGVMWSVGMRLYSALPWCWYIDQYRKW